MSQTNFAPAPVKTEEVTYDAAVAAAAEKACGRTARKFQKSSADGKGDRFTITRWDGKVTSVTCDFDPIF